MWKILAVVLWAGIPFLWQPLWGQAPGVGVKAGSQQKKQSKLTTDQPREDKRGTSDSPLIIETHSRPDSPEEAAKHKSENDTKESRDRWSFGLTVAYVAFTGLLVIIGGVGVYAANRTLIAIERQTTALVESQRPQIAAEAHGDPTKTLMDPVDPRIVIELKNRGLTTIGDFVYETWIEVLTLPFSDFSPSADYFKSTTPTVIYPKAPFAIRIPIRKGLSEVERKELRNGDRHVCFRIRANYSDPFSPKREVGFAFAVHPDGLEHLPKYNQPAKDS